MTDRLSTLLHDEAAALDVPPVPHDILAAGHREVRNRRARTALAGAVAVLLVAVGATAAVDRWRDGKDAIEPTGQLAYQQWGAWADGDVVHVGNHAVVLPGVQKLQYTSVGVVVSTTDNRLVLVDPAGQRKPLELRMDTRSLTASVGTDPTAPYLAYIHRLDAKTDQLAVRDLSTGQETPVGEPFPARRNASSSVSSLSGDVVFYEGPGDLDAVNWRTGEPVTVSYGSGVWYSGIGAGGVIGYDQGAQEWVVWSPSDGSALLRVPSGEPATASASLSVDNRYLAVSSGPDNMDGIDVYSIATGKSVHLEHGHSVGAYGWTPDGHLIGMPQEEPGLEVETCDPETGTCQGTGVTLDDRLLLAEGLNGTSG